MIYKLKKLHHLALNGTLKQWAKNFFEKTWHLGL